MSTIAEIREILSAASAPLSTSEILEKLGLEDASRDEKKPAYSAIQNGVLAGHFTRNHSSEGLTYSIAPAGQSGYGERARKGTKKGPKPGAKGPARASAPSARAKAEFPRAPEPVLDSEGHRTTLGKMYPDSSRNMAPQQSPSDFDLRRRLDAIGTDIADAIADACDAQHPHALIKALVVSREAVSRAQQALPLS